MTVRKDRFRLERDWRRRLFHLTKYDKSTLADFLVTGVAVSLIFGGIVFIIYGLEQIGEYLFNQPFINR